MKSLESFLLSKTGVLLANGMLASAWLFFAYNHITAYQGNDSWILLLFLAMETAVILFALTRHAPKSISMQPFDWVVGMLGTGLPLFLQPGGTLVHVNGGVSLMLIGAGLAVLSYLSLNQSLGLIAADRGVKTNGLYRFVRHPMYGSYVVLQLGYVLINLQPINIGIVLMSTFCNAARAVREEKFLARNSDYRAYQEKVKWRFIPYLF